MTTLFTPLHVGALQLPNRIVMAPLTRARAGATHIPNDMMVDYYSQRASSGLMMTECTMVDAHACAFTGESGIYIPAHVAGWKRAPTKFLGMWIGRSQQIVRLLRRNNLHTTALVVLLTAAVLTACTEREAPSPISSPASGEWSKIGETDSLAYYADLQHIQKADETVTMTDLFDYRTMQGEGGEAPALSKLTLRAYDCQNQTSQTVKTIWYAGPMGTGAIARSSNGPSQMSAVAVGTATANLMTRACTS